MMTTATIAKPLEVLPGVRLWPAYLDAQQQRTLAAEVFRLAETAPFYRPTMPQSGKPFSVDETNFGSLGWYSDANGYRYEKHHPVTGRPWPKIPSILLATWRVLADYACDPECCLVNLYRSGARMGLHQDRDEEALDAPVMSVSLGDDAVFRIGGDTRKGSTRSVRLTSGDVLLFGGPARLAFHGIDRVAEATSQVVHGGGRLNLTLRRVNSPKFLQKDARPGG